jgi:hypothetical protein
MVLRIVWACFLVFSVADLGAAVGLDSSYFDLAVFLVVFTSACLGASVIGLGLRLGVSVEVALTTRPTRTTCFFPALRFLCSAGGCPPSFQGGRAACSGIPLASFGCLFASAAFVSLHFTQPQKFAVRSPS